MKVLKWKGLITLFFFLIITFVYVKFQGGFVSGFLFSVVLAILLFELILLAGSSGRIKVRRHLNKARFTAGERLEAEIEVIFPGFLPLLWITVEDRLPHRLQGLTEENRIWKLVGFQKRIDYRYTVEGIPRGEYQLNEIIVHVGDLFGLFQREIIVRVPESLLVYPKYHEIRSFRSVNDKNIGMTYSLNRTAEDVTSVMGIRDYVNGDRLSRIHWKASARSGQLKTKEFEYNVTNDFMFFIDCEVYGYKGNEHLFERAISLTATMVKYAFSNHFTVGVSTFREDEIVIPMARHQDHLVRIFEELARLECDSTYPFVKLLMKQISMLPYGTTAMVVTARINEELIKAITLMRMRKMAVEFFWITDQMHEQAKIDALIREGVSIHIVDRDDLLVGMKGVGLNGKIS